MGIEIIPMLKIAIMRYKYGVTVTLYSLDPMGPKTLMYLIYRLQLAIRTFQVMHPLCEKNFMKFYFKMPCFDTITRYVKLVKRVISFKFGRLWGL